jgi:hypothetical protein
MSKNTIHVNGPVFVLANTLRTNNLRDLAIQAGCRIEAATDGIGSVVFLLPEAVWPNYKVLLAPSGELIGLMKKKVVNEKFTWSGETSVNEFARAIHQIINSKKKAAKTSSKETFNSGSGQWEPTVNKSIQWRDLPPDGPAGPPNPTPSATQTEDVMPEPPPDDYEEYSSLF